MSLVGVLYEQGMKDSVFHLDEAVGRGGGKGCTSDKKNWYISWQQHRQQHGTAICRALQAMVSSLMLGGGGEAEEGACRAGWEVDGAMTADPTVRCCLHIHGVLGGGGNVLMRFGKQCGFSTSRPYVSSSRPYACRNGL